MDYRASVFTSESCYHQLEPPQWCTEYRVAIAAKKYLSTSVAWLLGFGNLCGGRSVEVRKLMDLAFVILEPADV